MRWQGFIPESRWQELEIKVAKLNKRAAKIGVPPISLQLTGKTQRDEADWPYVFVAVEIIMEGETPKFAGWKLLAVLQHDPNLDANIVRTVPGETVPEDYRTRPGVCDHCGYARYRKETFVVEQEATKELKQVGRQCVADFLGHGDPRRFIKTWEYFEDAREWCEEGWGGGFRDERQPYSLKAFVAMSNAVIRKFGWVSGSKAYETGQTSTATEVVLQFGDRRGMREEDKVRPDETDNEYAEKVVAWALTINPNGSEYEHNLLTIAKQNYVIRKTEGYAASMVMAYKRANEVYEKKVKKVSDYFGKPGDKVNLTLLYKATYSFDSSWGVVHLHRFIDEETGNIFIWQGYTYTNMVEGATYKVKGTVKRHKDYKDIKQTILTRCKVEEVK